MFIDLIMALVVAGLATAVLVAAIGWDGYAAGGLPTAVVVFGLFFLVVWAGGIWLTPLGPETFGAAAAWLPFVVVAFIAGLLWAAAAPLRAPQSSHTAVEQAQAREVTSTTAVVIAAVVALVCIASLVLHYAFIVAPPR